ncbi:MAG: HAD hydrolase family protein [Veillonellales bacterium]
MDTEIRAKRIRLLIFDVDGVLTNGQIVIGRDGEILKKFYAQDGLGITAAHRAGLKTAIITGRQSDIVSIRGAELKITDVYQGAMNKVTALEQLLAKHKLTLEQVGYVGDDLNDLAIMLQVGLACAVADAVPEVKAKAHFVAVHAGGKGAVREIIEMILKAQNRWDEVLASYSRPGIIETRQ